MMTDTKTTQLDKILALADSNHDGEALVAVRKARQMLSRDGLSFGDLARAAQQKPRINLPFGLLSNQHVVHLETEIMQLRQELEDMRADKVSHELQSDLWRQRAGDLEQKLNISRADAERWRQLARDTVERLWDMSQEMHQVEPVLGATEPAKTA